MMQQRRQEVVDPKEAWRDIGNAWQLRTRQLACLQLLADWRLRKARERDLAVNFVVREEHLWAWRAICRAAWASWTAWTFRAAKFVSTAKR
jgi:ribonuclease D